MENSEKKVGNYGDYASYMPEGHVDSEKASTVGSGTAGASASNQTQVQGGPEQHKDAQPQIKERIDTAINDTAGKLREAAQKLENYGQPGSTTDQYTDKAARQINRGADYLESTDTEKLTSQVQVTVRRNPLASLGIAFGVGFVIARILKR